MQNQKVQHISITFDDDSVAVMSFILEPDLPVGTEIIGYDPATGKREATDEAIQYEINKSAWLAKPVSWRRIEHEEIPQDRYFRAAWKDSGKLEIDMPKAREIHKDHLRKAREPLLAGLDIEYTLADEKGDNTEKKKVAQKKQALRDITELPEIEKAKTPEQLKAVWPEILK